MKYKYTTKFLIVDDTDIIANLLSQQISTHYESNIKVVKAFSGKDALNIIKKEDIDILITDIKMPEMDGIDLLREVKKINDNIVPVLMSAYSDFESITNAINECNIVAFINKPWDSSHLFIILDSIIDKVQLEKDNKELHKQINRGFYDLLDLTKEIIAELSPDLHSLSNHVLALALATADKLNLSDTEKQDLQSASNLYILGLLGLPPKIYKMHYKQLPSELKQMYDKYPEVSAEMIKSNINLSNVQKIIRAINENIDGSGPLKMSGKSIPIETKILKICNEYSSAVLLRERNKENTLIQMRRKSNVFFDKKCFSAFTKVLSERLGDLKLPLKVNELKPGMVLSENLISKNGSILLPKGSAMTTLKLKRLLIYNVTEPIEEVFITIN